MITRSLLTTRIEFEFDVRKNGQMEDNKELSKNSDTT